MSKVIFYCDNDSPTNKLIGETLKKSGYDTESFFDPLVLLSRLEHRQPNLILLDIIYPNLDGYDILKSLKDNSFYSNIPVIIISSKSEENDIVKALDMGASDYIVKPFGIKELIARIKANLRKVSSYESKVLSVGDISLNLSKIKLYYKDNEIPLRAKEFDLLKYLMENSGNVVTRAELFKEIWGISCAIETRTIDAHITTLRRKMIKYCGRNYIETVRGVGYLIKE